MTSILPADSESFKNRLAVKGPGPDKSLSAGGRREGVDGGQARLQQACADFEALLIHKLFQTMRAAIPKSGLIDAGPAEDIYTAMLDQQVARDLALQGGLGLSSRIKEQIVQYAGHPGTQDE